MTTLVMNYAAKLLAQCSGPWLEGSGLAVTDEVDAALDNFISTMSKADLFALLWTLEKGVDGDALDGDITNNSVDVMLRSIATAALKDSILYLSGYFVLRDEERRGSDG